MYKRQQHPLTSSRQRKYLIFVTKNLFLNQMTDAPRIFNNIKLERFNIFWQGKSCKSFKV